MIIIAQILYAAFLEAGMLTFKVMPWRLPSTEEMLGGFPTRLAPDTLAHVKWRAPFRDPPALAELTREITTAQFQGYLI